MDNQFKKFNEDFFKSMTSYHIKWFDKEGFIELDSNRRVSIRLDDNGTRDHFNGYWVEIINKLSGTVYKKFFRFKYHMELVHRDTSKYFHVWYNSGKLDWYISRPKIGGEKVMVNTIVQFINQFK
jgi:hypothetical protein